MIFFSHDFVYVFSVFCIHGHVSFLPTVGFDVQCVCACVVVACYEIAFVQQQNVQKWQGESISAGLFSFFEYFLFFVLLSSVACVYTFSNLFELQIYSSSLAPHLSPSSSAHSSTLDSYINCCLLSAAERRKNPEYSFFQAHIHAVVRCERVCVAVCDAWTRNREKKNSEEANAFTAMTWKSFSMCNSLVASV